MFLSAERALRHDLETPPALVQWKAGQENRNKGLAYVRDRTRSRRMVVNGVTIEAVERGQGRPILFLHPGIGIDPAAPVLDRARQGRPRHRAVASGLRHLATAEGHDDRRRPLVFLSRPARSARPARRAGGRRRPRRLDRGRDRGEEFDRGCRGWCMANAVGIKVGDRETRDIVDIWSLMPDEFNELAYFDPKVGERDYKNLPEAESLAAARNREATARLAWSPYMHNPKLKGRLHRIKLPTLFLWGTADRILSETYGRAYCAPDPRRAVRDHREGRPLPASSSSRTNSPAGCSPSPMPRRRPHAPRRAKETDHAGLSLHRAALYPAWNDHARLAARQPAQPACSIRRSPATCSTATTTSGCWPTSSASTSWSTSITRPRPACPRPSIVGLSVLARQTKKRAHPGARLSDRPPPRSAALRRGALHHRRDLARPARHGLHQGRALRVPGVERRIRSA